MNTLLVIGATGFVGRRFIKEILGYAQPKGIRVQATGRNPSKLKKLIHEHPSVDFSSLDTLDSSEVEKKVKQAQVVVNCAGPFDLYAENVVSACARNGVHYLDITGEIVFGRRMIENYNQNAENSGALIVPFAGFDSVPSDMCTFLIAEEFENQHHQPLDSVDLVFTDKGGLNGGTAVTALDMNQKLSKIDLMNRYYMVPDLPNSQQSDLYQARYLPEINKWGAPFFMESINSKVVHRSLFLSNNSKKYFTESFTYRESIVLPGGVLAAWGLSRAMKVGHTLLTYKLGRKIASMFLPKPGQGPSEKSVQNGFFKIDVIARGINKKVLLKQMRCQGDPGNKATVKLLMACTKAICENDYVHGGGLRTPSTAFGKKLLPHLINEGIEWT